MSPSHGGAPALDTHVELGEVGAHDLAHHLGYWTLRLVGEETKGREESREKGCLLILEEEEAEGVGRRDRISLGLAGINISLVPACTCTNAGPGPLLSPCFHLNRREGVI